MVATNLMHVCVRACVSVCTIGDYMYAPPTLKGLAGQTKDWSLPRKSSSSSSFSSRLGERGARVSPHHASLSRCFRTWVHQWEAYRAVTSHTVLATAANVMVENEAYNSQLRVTTCAKYASSFTLQDYSTSLGVRIYCCHGY